MRGPQTDALERMSQDHRHSAARALALQVGLAYSPVLKGFSAATAVYYALISLSHPFFETGADLLLLNGLSIIAALWSLAVWCWLRRGPSDPRRLEAAAALIYVLFFANIAAYLSIHFVPHKLIYFVLLALVSGTTAPSGRLAIGAVAMSMAGLVAFGRHADGDFIDEYAFMGFAGCFASLGMALLMRGAVVRELQARMAAEALAVSAQAANRAQTAFLATMSHEIRTPLNGVLGMTQVMERDDLSPAQRKRLEVMNASARSLLEIINDILDMSKVEAGRLDIHPAEFRLDLLAESLRRLYEPLAQERGLTFDLACDVPAPAWRFGDEARLRQILGNLLGNALKFTVKGGVRLTISATAERLVCVVSDTGAGIAPDDQERVFDRFFQSDSSNTRSAGGAGLGLAICRELAQLMDGGITVSSAPGAGAAFTVDLAMPEAFPADRPKPMTVAEDRPLDRIRVLVVDDNATNRFVMTTLLEPLGAAVATVADGRHAVNAWAAADWDAILMDIHMPELDGVAATRLIRAAEHERSRPHTPIIAVTASVLPNEVQAYLAAGMDDVVAKPVACELLVEKLRRHIALAPAAAPAPRLRVVS